MRHHTKISSHVVLVSAVLLGVVGFYAIAALRFPTLYIWGTYEDLFGEWVQFWAIVVALVVSARLAWAKWPCRRFFLVLALCCFYVAMEEISWGQRIFDFASPDYFRAKNLQGETNLHNFLTGPFGTPLKTVLTWGLATALLAYGLIYPVALRGGTRVAKWLTARGLLPPPLYLSSFFVAGAILEFGPFGLNEAEVAEILVGLGLAMTAMHYLAVRQCLKGADDPVRQAPGSIACGAASVPPGLTRRLVFVIILVPALSAVTTTALFASPHHRARILNRLENGYEKFAARYARYEQWSTAIDLYERVRAKHPESVHITRRIAECAASAGEPARADRYLRQALAFDLRRYELNPESAGVNRSLARTYRSMGDEERAQEHLQLALRINLRRIERKPKSASAQYSLGRTYSMLQQHGRALEHLSKAFALEPTSKKYRRAYFKARKRVS